MISNMFYSAKTDDNYLNWSYSYRNDKPKEVLMNKRIADIIQTAVNRPNCTTCFEAINAVPIIKQTPIAIVTESVFTDPDYDSNWTPDKFVAEALRKAYKDSKSLMVWLLSLPVTTGDITPVGEIGGKRYIGITNSGMNETYDAFSVTFNSRTTSFRWYRR